MNELPIVQFGKYKGKSILEFMEDKKYLEWCKSQPGMLEKYPSVFNIIYQQNTKNNDTPTPEHNKLQNMFLNKNVKFNLFKIFLNSELEELKSLNNNEIFNEYFENINIENVINDMKNYVIDEKCFVKFESYHNWDITMSVYGNPIKLIFKNTKREIYSKKKYDIYKLEMEKLIKDFDVEYDLDMKNIEKYKIKYLEDKENYHKIETEWNLWYSNFKEYIQNIRSELSKEYDCDFSKVILNKEKFSFVEESYQNTQNKLEFKIFDDSKIKPKIKIYRTELINKLNLFKDDYIKNKNPQPLNIFNVSKPKFYTYNIQCDKKFEELIRYNLIYCIKEWESVNLDEIIAKYNSFFNFDNIVSLKYMSSFEKIKEKYSHYNSENFYNENLKDFITKGNEFLFKDMSKNLDIENNKYFYYNFGFDKCFYNNICIEIKTILGDDYPCVLRKMSNQIKLRNPESKCDKYCLIIDKFNSSVTSFDELKTIFNQHNIKVILTSEIFGDDINFYLTPEQLKIKELENEIKQLKEKINIIN
jgi:hypothetical protein